MVGLQNTPSAYCGDSVVTVEGGLEWEGGSVVTRKPILDLFPGLLSPCLSLPVFVPVHTHVHTSVW